MRGNKVRKLFFHNQSEEDITSAYDAEVDIGVIFLQHPPCDIQLAGKRTREQGKFSVTEYKKTRSDRLLYQNSRIIRNIGICLGIVWLMSDNIRML
jgi:hypothetical protein